MTERFNAEAQQTVQGQSGVGPSITPSSLTALGVGQGSGTSATAQERNSSIAFEFPIRWDDLAKDLGALTTPKNLENYLDDMTVRDRQLEDFLNTNIVNGIVAGSNITIDRATGVVTITAAAPAWTSFSPKVYNGANTAATITQANSAYCRIGSLVIARVNLTATWATATYPTYVTTMPTQIKPAVNSAYAIGSCQIAAISATMVNSQTTANDRIDFLHDATPANKTAWDMGFTVTYEAV